MANIDCHYNCSPHLYILGGECGCSSYNVTEGHTLPGQVLCLFWLCFWTHTIYFSSGGHFGFSIYISQGTATWSVRDRSLDHLHTSYIVYSPWNSFIVASSRSQCILLLKKLQISWWSRTRVESEKRKLNGESKILLLNCLFQQWNIDIPLPYWLVGSRTGLGGKIVFTYVTQIEVGYPNSFSLVTLAAL